MKLRLTALMLFCALLLTGCGWLDGTYVSVTPHQEQTAGDRTENLMVSDYDELVRALETVVSKGTENCVINAVNYDPEELQTNLSSATRYIQKMYPLGAYAVETMNCEVGSSTGKLAIALDVTYRHGWTEIRKIQKAKTVADAHKAIGRSLENYDAVLVLDFEEYEDIDFYQVVQDYAQEKPQKVMEIPQLTTEVYGTGVSRVVELIFAYQTSRDALRAMQSQVQPVFDSAVLYVSGEGTQQQKFSQLYAFLMERFDYMVETSITPAYSLLRHGVGDSRAFATVYAAMCRAAGLECMVVTGTRSGEPWTWNLVQIEDGWYHVDLLRCSEGGRFARQMDDEMTGYVWDYSAYPACSGVEETEATEEKIF